MPAVRGAWKAAVAAVVLGFFLPATAEARPVYSLSFGSTEEPVEAGAVTASDFTSAATFGPIAGSPFTASHPGTQYGAMTSDGAHLYVSNGYSNNLNVFDVGSAGALLNRRTVTAPYGVPRRIAISPDDAHLYAISEGSPLVNVWDIAVGGGLTNHRWASLGSSTGTTIAISPNGDHLYASVNNGVHLFDIAADGSLEHRTWVTVHPRAYGAAVISPNGKHLYYGYPNGIRALDLLSDGVPSNGRSFKPPVEPSTDLRPQWGIAMTSDGGTLLSTDTSHGELHAWSVAANGDLENLQSTPLSGIGRDVAVAPNGRILTADRGSNQLRAHTLGRAGQLIPGASTPVAGIQGVVVTPNRGPIAGFTATGTESGEPTTFDASSSSDPDGSIALYEWDFGDGSTWRTFEPQTSHTYTEPGAYEVTLRVIDNENCSTKFIYTGHMARCTGGPAAEAAEVLTIADTTAPDPPTLTTSPASPANDNTPWVRGNAEPGSDVEVYVNAACTGQAAAIGKAGNFASPGLEIFVDDDTSVAIFAAATDRHGNRSDCARSIEYREDSTPPEAQIKKLKLTPRQRAVRARFLGSDAGQAAALTFTCKLDKKAARACESPAVFKRVKPGRHKLVVTASDAAGNKSKPAKKRFRMKRRK